MLRLNLLKYKVMSLGNSHVMAEYILRDESGEYVELTKVDHEKDLGVWISSGTLNHPCIAPRL